MAVATVRRRLRNLESVLTIVPEYPPFTPEEIEDIDRRARAGMRFAPAELRRMEQHSPILQGELVISCHRGDVFIKRYVGVDLSAI